jgi:beta-lactamase class D
MKPKKRIFDSWKKDQLWFGILENEFVWVLANILNAIQAIARLNRSVLKEIEYGA